MGLQPMCRGWVSSSACVSVDTTGTIVDKAEATLILPAFCPTPVREPCTHLKQTAQKQQTNAHFPHPELTVVAGRPLGREVCSLGRLPGKQGPELAGRHPWAGHHPLLPPGTRTCCWSCRTMPCTGSWQGRGRTLTLKPRPVGFCTSDKKKTQPYLIPASAIGSPPHEARPIPNRQTCQYLKIPFHTKVWISSISLKIG